MGTNIIRGTQKNINGDFRSNIRYVILKERIFHVHLLELGLTDLWPSRRGASAVSCPLGWTGCIGSGRGRPPALCPPGGTGRGARCSTSPPPSFSPRACSPERGGGVTLYSFDVDILHAPPPLIKSLPKTWAAQAHFGFCESFTHSMCHLNLENIDIKKLLLT